MESINNLAHRKVSCQSLAERQKQMFAIKTKSLIMISASYTGQKLVSQNDSFEQFIDHQDSECEDEDLVSEFSECDEGELVLDFTKHLKISAEMKTQNSM